MRLVEIFEAEAPDTAYVNRMRNTLVDYLTSLVASGLKTNIPTKKIARFLKKRGFDVEPEQISTILANTQFDVDDKSVSLSMEPKEPEPDPADMMPEPEDDMQQQYGMEPEMEPGMDPYMEPGMDRPEQMKDKAEMERERKKQKVDHMANRQLSREF